MGTFGRKQTSRLCVVRVRIISWLAIAPMILFMLNNSKQTEAIFNCFTPNMFKMGKNGQQYMNPYVNGVANPVAVSQPNWYPQQAYQPQYSYNSGIQNPMKKLLFPSKWKSGGSGLFGTRGWMGNSWKMGANSNFYRPSYGYAPNSLSGFQGGYPLNEQLNISPLSLGSSYSSPNFGPTNYQTSPNDGWSAPLGGTTTYTSSPITTTTALQQQFSNYDSYSSSQPTPTRPQTSAPLVDAYGTTTKKTSGSTKGKLSSTTRNNILIADGGYNYSDDFYTVGNYGTKNGTYGYSYPNWYSGVVDSPAKIAQQLLKHGGFRKQQRLQEQQRYNNSSAQLLLDTTAVANLDGSTNAQFTILDEPRFVGFGTVDLLTNREAKLSCSFREAIDQTNRPLWVKFLGPYNSSHVINGKIVPPFNCANSQCRTQEVESTKDFRYKFDNGPATSTLIISDPKLADYGVYRCSALTKAINNNPLETIYQIIQFGTL